MIQCGMEYYLYWWRDHNHTDPWTEGYIGITKDLKGRKKGHRHEHDWFREDLECVILKEGLTAVEARDLERTYRPKMHIGWNKMCGGGMPPIGVSPHKFKKGQTNMNKGKKGLWGANSGSFKKGKSGNPATQFKKGCVPAVRRKDWPELCQEWKDSGLSKSQFSKQKGICRGALGREVKRWL